VALIEYIGTDVAAYAATYQTNADGSPVPFVSRWRVDAPSQPVAVYEDATGALLGSGTSSASPEASGPHAGWYLASVPITSWSSSAGALLPVMAAAGAMSEPSISAVLSVPSMACIGAMAELTYSAASEFTLPTMAGRGAMVAPAFSAEVTLPTMAGEGAMVAPTIEEGGGSGLTLVGVGTVVRQNVADGGTVTVPLPTGVQAGDALFVMFDGSLYGTTSAPTGWTEGVAQSVFRRLAPASPTAPVFTVNADDGEGPTSQFYTAQMIAIRGANASYLDGTISGPVQSSGTTVTGTAKTTSYANSMALMLVKTINSGGGHAQLTFSSPGGSVDTIAAQSNAANYSSFCFAYDDAPSNSAGAKAAPTLGVSPSSSVNVHTLFVRAA
jgi:hypothetical protein